MRRSIPTLLLISAAIALTACGEYSTTEPQSGARNLGPSFAGYAVSGDDGGNAAAAALTPVQDGGSVTFYSTGGTIQLGTWTLTYRQNSVSICDENGQHCTPLSGSVTGTAHFGLVNGAPSLSIDLPDASQHLYFATPGAKLSTSYYAASGKSIIKNGGGLGILYAPTYGSPRELNAPKSHFDAGTGSLWRWVTHFSGYAVSGNGDCDPSVDPTCASTPAM